MTQSSLEAAKAQAKALRQALQAEGTTVRAGFVRQAAAPDPKALCCPR